MTLSVVATPIGNLGDISARAKEVLEKATLLICEDTRSTKKLLSLLGSPTSKLDREFVSSHAQSTPNALIKAIERCEEHEYIALVTDAGTPAISDPGSQFITAFRAHYPESSIVPIPGPSSVITALSVAGFPGSHFEFLGFVPHKKGRQTLFFEIDKTEHIVIILESPHRIMKTLEALCILENRQIMVGREMTKQFEEYKVGKPKELLTYYQKNSDKVRGEFIIVISPKYYKAF